MGPRRRSYWNHAIITPVDRQLLPDEVGDVY